MKNCKKYYFLLKGFVVEQYIISWRTGSTHISFVLTLDIMPLCG